MGYRVGFYCFDTEQSATDYKMSQVLPYINASGQLVYPQQRNGKWEYQGQVITLSHGQCDPRAEFVEGLQVGLMFWGLFVLVYMIKVALYAINAFFDVEEREQRD